VTFEFHSFFKDSRGSFSKDVALKKCKAPHIFDIDVLSYCEGYPLSELSLDCLIQPDRRVCVTMCFFLLILLLVSSRSRN
jgi:hypothetical protein